jgi:tRNA(Ile)-lysidine synthase
MSTPAEVLDTIRTSGLITPGSSLLVMLSGGADSVCLVHASRELLGSEAIIALHVNHGLREQADADEEFCVDLCGRLGIRLEHEKLRLPARGNVEASAREGRYRAAERVRKRHGLDWIATGHTASDQVETVLYRLVSSPGRRALLGIGRRSDRLVRPLIGLSRDQTRDYCRALGLEWREDESNLDRGLARNRLRLDILPALREIHPAADQNVLVTAEQLAEEAELLDAAVEEASEQVATAGGEPALDGARLQALPPALRRLVLRRLAEQSAGGPLPLRADQVNQIEELAKRPGSASLDLGTGVRVTSEYGVLRFHRSLGRSEPTPVSLPVPGRCRFGDWELVCELEQTARPPADLGAPDEAVLDAARLAPELSVRSWRDGDRMQPLGLGGTKSLQDLFTDLKVPRSLRHSLPVVTSDGEIVWVAGVALSDLFRVTVDTSSAARLQASAVPNG